MRQRGGICSSRPRFFSKGQYTSCFGADNHKAIMFRIPAFIVSVLMSAAVFLPDACCEPLKVKEGDSPVDGKTIFLDNLRTRPVKNLGRRPGARQSAGLFLETVKQHFEIMNPDRSLSFRKITRDSLGMRKLVYNQVLNKVPVLGSGLIVHERRNLSVKSVLGRIEKSLNVNTVPKITAAEAQALAAQIWESQHQGSKPSLAPANLVILPRSLVSESMTSPQDYLIWEVELRDSNLMSGAYYQLDAHTGKLLGESSIVNSLHREVWDCGRADYACYLGFFDPAVNHTYGRAEGQDNVGRNPFFGWYDTDALYMALENSHDYYNGRFGRNGANQQGGTEDSRPYMALNRPWITRGYTYIHYSPFTNYGREYCPYGAFSDGLAVYFCDDMVSPDTVGHEYTHSVIYHTIHDSYNNPRGFQYYGESGAISEGLADILGVAVRQYMYPDQGSDRHWKLGVDLMTGYIRNLANPADRADSVGVIADRYHSPNFYCGTADYGGAHHNSGAIEKAAFLISDGGSFNGCTVTGIGYEKEEQIFYRALTHYLTRFSTFNDLYYALLEACDDMYSRTECFEVRKALQAVELNQPGRCSGLPARGPDACTGRDTTPPNITITSPSNFTAVRGDSVITFTDDEITRPRCGLNSYPAVSCRSGALRLGDLPGWTKAGKKVTLYVTDTDAAGNTATAVMPKLRRAMR